jgi:dihydroorotase
MRTALEYAKIFGIPVADHCEDMSLAHGGAMHEGVVSVRLGLKGIPSAAEEIMVARDIILAELTGGHVHLCHMSTRGSVELIRRAKEKGLRVTAEATPHHFALTHHRCEGYDTDAKIRQRPLPIAAPTHTRKHHNQLPLFASLAHGCARPCHNQRRIPA